MYVDLNKVFIQVRKYKALLIMAMAMHNIAAQIHTTVHRQVCTLHLTVLHNKKLQLQMFL